MTPIDRTLADIVLELTAYDVLASLGLLALQFREFGRPSPMQAAGVLVGVGALAIAFMDFQLRLPALGLALAAAGGGFLAADHRGLVQEDIWKRHGAVLRLVPIILLVFGIAKTAYYVQAALTENPTSGIVMPLTFCAFISGLLAKYAVGAGTMHRRCASVSGQAEPDRER